MRRLLPTLLALATAAAAQDDRAERFVAQEREAFGHFEQERWAEAIAAFEAQIAIFADNPRPYYNIACAYARQGNAARAATWLRLSIARGWRDAEHLAQDSDFAAVRDDAAFKACLDLLAQARRADPDPLPRRVAPESVPAAQAVGFILAASYIEERALQATEPLLGAHDYRKRLFRLYDERMATLARYIAENGDARDAHEAARARVDTAARYLETATTDSAADRSLRTLAARYVLATAAEFLRGYPGSPLLSHVLLLRAHALRKLGRTTAAEEALRVVIADHPGGDNATRARLQLCILLADAGRTDDLRKTFKPLRSEADVNPAIAQALRGPEMLRARLLAEGLPRGVVAKLVPDPNYAGVYVFVFV
jgi:tetratricopeptide (TPR) repeat protein